MKRNEKIKNLLDIIHKEGGGIKRGFFTIEEMQYWARQLDFAIENENKMFPTKIDNHFDNYTDMIYGPFILK